MTTQTSSENILTGELAETLIENAGHSIYVTDTDGVIQYVNPAFEKMTGYSATEAIGQTPRILKSGQHSKNFYENMWETISNGNVWRDELINKNKNGDIYYAEQTISPVLDNAGNPEAFIAINTDITPLKEHEQELEETNALLDSILGNLPDIVFMKDAKTLEYVAVNPAFEDFIDTPQHEIIGKTDLDLFNEDDARKFRSQDRDILENDKMDVFEEIVVTNTEGRRWHRTKKVPVSFMDGDDPDYLLGISEDITERKKKESFIDRFFSRLEEDHAKIARELHDQVGQQLLFSLLKLNELTDSPSETDESVVQEIISTIRKTLDQIRDISSLLKPQSLEDATLVQALQAYVKKMNYQYEANVQFEKVGITDSKDSILSDKEDKTGIYRIAQEALRNALEHGDPDEVTLLITVYEDTLTLLIEDDGSGFDLHKLRQEKPRRERVGINNMEERIRLLDGSFNIETAPGDGTSVKAEIPINADEEVH